jgi:nucleoid-associated protein YgaU
MGLEKALIQPLDSKGNNHGEKFAVLFNPAEYTIETSNKFSSVEIPGLTTPLAQFAAGSARTLSMELFFDSYEKGEDVRTHTNKIMSLLEIDSELHAPPLCKFIWGKLEFKAFIERATQKFIMFLGSGVPVRAKLTVTFKEYRSMTEQMQSPPRHSSDRTKRRVVKAGDSLWQIAYKEYGDAAQWRAIASANNIENPRVLDPGTEIVIPPLR